jgi:hypothetical protein
MAENSNQEQIVSSVRWRTREPPERNPVSAFRHLSSVHKWD